MGAANAGDCQAGEAHGRSGENVWCASGISGDAKAVAGGAKGGDGETTGSAGLARGTCTCAKGGHRGTNALAMRNARPKAETGLVRTGRGTTFAEDGEERPPEAGGAVLAARQ